MSRHEFVCFNEALKENEPAVENTTEN